MRTLKAGMFFNRALLWLVLMHLSESEPMQMLFAVNVLFNLWLSYREASK